MKKAAVVAAVLVLASGVVCADEAEELISSCVDTLGGRDAESAECPLWVISGHFSARQAFPLYPRKRT